MTALGKRKSRSSIEEEDCKDQTLPEEKETPLSSSTAISYEKYAALLRSHFETQFEPLQQDDNSETSSSWSGCSANDNTNEYDSSLRDEQLDCGPSDEENIDLLSSDEADTNQNQIEIIDHSHSSSTPPTSAVVIMSRREQKRYLSTKPPSLSTSSPSQPRPPQQADQEEETPDSAAAMLQNDVALSRLLAESHLLSSLHTHRASGTNPRSVSSTIPASEEGGVKVEGPSAFGDRRSRLAARTLRLASVGARTPVSGRAAQKKMPMGVRKGIIAAETIREARRRREAKENGIILERFGGSGSVGKKRSSSRREIAVDMPGIGRMKGAELRLSKKDIRLMEGAGSEGKGGRNIKGGKRRR